MGWQNIAFGPIAHLVERRIRIAKVAGSSPARSTNCSLTKQHLTGGKTMFLEIITPALLFLGSILVAILLYNRSKRLADKLNAIFWPLFIAGFLNTLIAMIRIDWTFISKNQLTILVALPILIIAIGFFFKVDFIYRFERKKGANIEEIF